MFDLLVRIENIEKILAKPFSNITKIIRSFQQFSGLNLTALEPSVKSIIESNFVQVNQIISQYDINTFDDYSKIKKKHSQQLLNIISILCRDLRNSLNIPLM